MRSSTEFASTVRGVLVCSAIVQASQLESAPATLPDVARSGWRFLAVHAAAALLAAVVAILLAATGAAATDDLGATIGDAVRAGEEADEPAVEMVTPLVEPVLEQHGERLDSLAGTLPPVTPITPIMPIRDVVGPIPPPDVPAMTPRSAPSRVTEISAARRSPTLPTLPTLPTPVDAPTATAISVVASQDHVAIDGERTPTSGPGDPIDALGAAHSGSAGTTLIALVIGVSMAIPAGWATAAFRARLRPIGLTLSPPVPPG